MDINVREVLREQGGKVLDRRELGRAVPYDDREHVVVVRFKQLMVFGFADNERVTA